jgi:hypothetical protein
MANSDADGFRQVVLVAQNPCRKENGRRTMDPRRLFNEQSSWSGFSGLQFKGSAKVTQWLLATTWKGPHDTAPIWLRAAPP